MKELLNLRVKIYNIFKILETSFSLPNWLIHKPSKQKHGSSP